MNHGIDLKILLLASGKKPSEQLAVFAWLNLGLIESLSHGLVSATDAVRVLYNGDNCLFVRKQFKEEAADEIMSRAVQLPDLFEALPPEEAHREFQRELTTMRSLCVKLLENKQLVA